MRSVFSEKPCDNCNADRQIGNPYNWQRQCDRCTKIGQWRNEVLKRLAEIENILGDEYDLDRLKELTQADKEGRCLVLPCKVGDTYYAIQKTCSDGGYAKKGEYFPCESDCEYCDIRDCDKEFIIREHKFNSLNFIVDYMEYIGEFLFLTKEEAEKALEGLE